MTALRFALSLLLLTLAWSGAVAATPDAAVAYVQKRGEETIAILADPAATPEARLAKMQEMLDRSLDLPQIGRILVGAPWRQLTPEQQTETQALIREYVLNKYAQFMSRYGGETFRIDGATPTGREDVLVSSAVLRNGQPWATLEWRITGPDAALRILDVVVENISLVQTEKSQIQALLQESGVAGLAAALRTRLAASPQ